MFLPKVFFPAHSKNRMHHEGDVHYAREVFYKAKPANLVHLLETRYEWMKPFLSEKKMTIEVGSGAGFSREFIRHPRLVLTDVLSNDWIDLRMDALSLPFGSGVVDAVLASHMIHHLEKPTLFFKEISRILKPGGLLVIQEINTCWLMKLSLYLMRHEGWSDVVDVFNQDEVCNQVNDPWSANCSIPYLLFKDSKAFEQKVPDFKVLKNEVCECLALVNSGGVIAKTKYIPLPKFLLRLVSGVDLVLTKLFPGIFAMGRRVVLQKRA